MVHLGHSCSWPFFFLIPLRKILLYIVEWPKCQWVQLVRYESVCFFRGVLREGDQLLLGPSIDGLFQPVTVTSVKRNRAACRVVRAGQAASVAISGIDRSLLRRVR